MTDRKIIHFYSWLSQVIEEEEIKETIKAAAYSSRQIKSLMLKRESEISDKVSTEHKNIIRLKQDLAEKELQVSNLIKEKRPTSRTVEQFDQSIEKIQTQKSTENQVPKSAYWLSIATVAIALLFLGIFSLFLWNAWPALAQKLENSNSLPLIIKSLAVFLTEADSFNVQLLVSALLSLLLMICFLFLCIKRTKNYAVEQHRIDKEEAKIEEEVNKLLFEKNQLIEWERAKANYERELGVVLLRDECEKLGSAIKEIVTAAIREEIRFKANERIGRSYLPQLTIYQSGGLSETIDLSRAIETESQRKLDFLLDQMPGGSIGIAGPRGSGKSTLIKMHCQPDSGHSCRRNTTSVLTSAPVEYEARDFLLHLYASLCRSVVQKHASTDEVDAWSFPETSTSFYRLNFFETVAHNHNRIMTFGTILVVLSFLSAFVLWKFDVAPAVNAAFSGELWKWGIPLLVVGYFASYFNRAFVKNSRSVSQVIAGYNFPASFAEYEAADADQIKKWQSEAGKLRRYSANESDYMKFRLAGREMERIIDGYAIKKKRNSLPAEAQRALTLLAEIKFQQSVSIGASGVLKMPVGFEAGANQTTTTTQMIMNTPEIVNALIDFLRYLTADGERRVIIGIDELDKLETEEQAPRFLNQIKSIFGVPHCFYLMTVSENAMHTFERRGLPFRDVFDSSFDEILYVEPMQLGTAENLLARRVVGKPFAFICLSYCLSGGLPRDFIRVFRGLLALVHRDKIENELSTLCTAFVAADLKAKLRATSFAAAKYRSRAPILKFINKLCHLENAEITPEKLFEESEQMLELSNTDISEDAQELTTMAKEFAVYLLFLATVLEFFTNSLEQRKLDDAERDDEFKCLARARRLLAVNHETSLTLINDFRQKNSMKVFAFSEN